MHHDRSPGLPAAIAFDLDGTLVDSVTDLTEASNRMLAEFGQKPLDEATVRGYIGDGAMKLVQRVLGDDEAQAREALRRFRRHYADCLLENTRCYPGVEDTLASLEQLGIPMGVVTNKPHEFSVRLVQGLGISRYFRSIVGARQGLPVKPAPEMLELCLAELDVDAAGSWMVGDSTNDLRVARAVGTKAIGLTYGIGSKASLVAESPDHLLDGFQEILELLP